MIENTAHHLLTAYLTPPAIERSYHSSNYLKEDIIPSYIYNYDKTKNTISFTNKNIYTNIFDYYGLENAMCNFNNCMNDAISRYEQVYNTKGYNILIINPFLEAIKNIILNLRFVPRFSFYPDGAKAVFTLEQQEITVEFDIDEPDCAFLSKSKNNVLYIKDTTVNNLSHAFGSFI